MRNHIIYGGYFLRLLCGGLLATLFMPFFLICALLPASFRYTNKIAYKGMSVFSRMILFILSIRWSITYGEEGRKKLFFTPSIVVMNHASALDILLVEALLASFPRAWMIKGEYGAIPFISWFLKKFHVLVKRTNRYKAAISLAEMKKLISVHNQHGLLFPEGKRYSDGAVHSFSEGFASLAFSLQRPVIPLYIKNAHKVLAKEAFFVNTNIPIEVVIGPSFVPYADETRHHFVERVFSWFKVQELHTRSII